MQALSQLSYTPTINLDCFTKITSPQRFCQEQYKNSPVFFIKSRFFFASFKNFVYHRIYYITYFIFYLKEPSFSIKSEFLFIYYIKKKEYNGYIVRSTPLIFIIYHAIAILYKCSIFIHEMPAKHLLVAIGHFPIDCLLIKHEIKYPVSENGEFYEYASRNRHWFHNR